MGIKSFNMKSYSLGAKSMTTQSSKKAAEFKPASTKATNTKAASQTKAHTKVSTKVPTTAPTHTSPSTSTKQTKPNNPLAQHFNTFTPAATKHESPLKKYEREYEANKQPPQVDPNAPKIIID